METSSMKTTQITTASNPPFLASGTHRSSFLLASTDGQKKVNQLGGEYLNGKPLPTMQRMHIIRMHNQGFKPSQIASHLKVSHGCVSKIVEHYRKTGSFEPRTFGTGKRIRLHSSTQPSTMSRKLHDPQRGAAPRPLSSDQATDSSSRSFPRCPPVSSSPADVALAAMAAVAAAQHPQPQSNPLDFLFMKSVFESSTPLFQQSHGTTNTRSPLIFPRSLSQQSTPDKPQLATSTDSTTLEDAVDSSSSRRLQLPFMNGQRFPQLSRSAEERDLSTSSEALDIGKRLLINRTTASTAFSSDDMPLRTAKSEMTSLTSPRLFVPSQQQHGQLLMNPNGALPTTTTTDSSHSTESDGLEVSLGMNHSASFGPGQASGRADQASLHPKASPSDTYDVFSQQRFHGSSPASSLALDEHAKVETPSGCLVEDVSAGLKRAPKTSFLVEHVISSSPSTVSKEEAHFEVVDGPGKLTSSTSTSASLPLWLPTRANTGPFGHQISDPLTRPSWADPAAAASIAQSMVAFNPLFHLSPAVAKMCVEQWQMSVAGGQFHIPPPAAPSPQLFQIPTNATFPLPPANLAMIQAAMMNMPHLFNNVFPPQK